MILNSIPRAERIPPSVLYKAIEAICLGGMEVGNTLSVKLVWLKQSVTVITVPDHWHLPVLSYR